MRYMNLHINASENTDYRGNLKSESNFDPNGYCAMVVLNLEEYSKLTDGAE